MARAQKPEAVVVGAGLNALGVVRSLAAENIAITVVDAAPGGPAIHSRFARARLHAPSVDLVDHLCRIAPSFDQPPILFLTQEATVALVSEQRERLTGAFRFCMPEKAVLQNLMDKAQFERLAQERGFPVPRAVVVRPQDASQAARLTYPCILKPVAKNEVWERRYKKAYKFTSADALLAFCASLEADAPAMIVQEWIEGEDADVYFTLVYRNERGETEASFTGRKIRQWPPLVGGTASCIAAPDAHATLADLTDRFFAAVGFTGLGSMEYKYDRRAQRFVMVEPTVGRTDFQEEIATLNGTNVVRAAYRSMARLPQLPTQPVKRNYAWREAAADARSHQAQPDAPVPSEASNATWIDALYRTSDPGPWLADLAGRVSARLFRSAR